MRGFTIIELMVVMVLVSLLLSILLPALRGARGKARGIVCLANLGSTGKQHAAWSGEHDDVWLNLFIDDFFAEELAYAADENMFYFPEYAQQADLWLLRLGEAETRDDWGYVLSSATSYEAYACPVVYVDEIGVPREDPTNSIPHNRALLSYFYSPTLVTAASVWTDRVEPVVDDDLLPFERRLVRTSDVSFTSAKAAMAERAGFHARRITSAAEPETESLNTLFTDGHVDTVPLRTTVPPLPTVGFGFEQFGLLGEPGDPVRVPFKSTPGGFRGLDTRPGG